MIQRVDLDEQEWQQVLGLISEAPWRVANPLLMKIGQQLMSQTRGEAQSAPPGGGIHLKQTNHGAGQQE